MIYLIVIACMYVGIAGVAMWIGARAIGPRLPLWLHITGALGVLLIVGSLILQQGF